MHLLLVFLASISRLRESLLLVSAPASRNGILEERELSSGVLAVAVQRSPSDWETVGDGPLVNAINVSAPAVVRRGPILILGPPQVPTQGPALKKTAMLLHLEDGILYIYQN